MKTKPPDDLIAVLPKNYQRIVKHIISVMPLAKIFANDIEVDVNDTNYISQDGMKDLLNFRILNGDDPVMGYHDHPSEMWISEKHRPLALYMEEQKWLTVQFPKRR